MFSDPDPITFTLVPLGRAYIPETKSIITIANTAQEAFRFEVGPKEIPIQKDKYTLKNKALDLRKAVRDLLRRQRFKYLTSESERQFIILTSESSSDEESAEDYGKKYGEEDVYKQCYFYHDTPFPDAKNIAIVSTYVWDNLPSIAKFPKTDLGRRALQPYLLLSFATIALSRCMGMDLPFHPETRGCPLDYCDTVQEIDRFFEEGRLCKECERFFQSQRQEGKITLKQLDSVKELLRIAADRPEEYDLFISHAWEDKDAIARALYSALVARGLKVWFDEATLELGDSLRRKIDDGIARCGFGIVILSPHFLRKEWPQRELDGLVARETASGEKAILPIWHELDAATLRRYSFTLADRVAARSEEGIPVLVDQILRVLKR